MSIYFQLDIYLIYLGVRHSCDPLVLAFSARTITVLRYQLIFICLLLLRSVVWVFRTAPSSLIILCWNESQQFAPIVETRINQFINSTLVCTAETDIHIFHRSWLDEQLYDLDTWRWQIISPANSLNLSVQPVTGNHTRVPMTAFRVLATSRPYQQLPDTRRFYLGKQMQKLGLSETLLSNQNEGSFVVSQNSFSLQHRMKIRLCISARLHLFVFAVKIGLTLHSISKPSQIKLLNLQRSQNGKAFTAGLVYLIQTWLLVLYTVCNNRIWE